jgi:hypothetical protein
MCPSSCDRSFFLMRQPRQRAKSPLCRFLFYGWTQPLEQLAEVPCGYTRIPVIYIRLDCYPDVRSWTRHPGRYELYDPWSGSPVSRIDHPSKRTSAVALNDFDVSRFNGTQRYVILAQAKVNHERKALRLAAVGSEIHDENTLMKMV